MTPNLIGTATNDPRMAIDIRSDTETEAVTNYLIVMASAGSESNRIGETAH